MNRDIKDHCIQNLYQLDTLLGALEAEDYTTPCTLLSGASIGQHMRHVLEFYVCLLKISDQREVNYDQRKRDLLLEQNIEYARQCITQIKDQLEIYPINTDESISVISGFSIDNELEQTHLRSSMQRELAYCLEHAIHHQALIKVALLSFDLSHLLDAQFGVAPSTLRYLSKSS